MKRIRFQGSEYWLINRENDQEGPIATPEAFKTGLPSHAHLFEDGRILRHGKQIGSRADLEWLGDVPEADAVIDNPAAAYLNMIMHPAWRKIVRDAAK